MCLEKNKRSAASSALRWFENNLECTKVSVRLMKTKLNTGMCDDLDAIYILASEMYLTEREGSTVGHCDKERDAASHPEELQLQPPAEDNRVLFGCIFGKEPV